MKRQDVIKHFGSQAAAAAAIGVNRSVFNCWGYIIPEKSAQSFFIESEGKLKLNRTEYIPDEIEQNGQKFKQVITSTFRQKGSAIYKTWLNKELYVKLSDGKLHPVATGHSSLLVEAAINYPMYKKIS